MARTKASVGAKVTSGKSNKATTVSCAPSSSSAPAGHSGSKKYSGGNPVCHREVPKWQKSITKFFPIVKESGDSSQESSVSDATTTKLPEIITDNVPNELTDDSDEIDEESFESLNGENCHKIQEYFEVQAGDGKNNERNNKNNDRDGKNNDRDGKNNDRDGKNNDGDVKNNDRDGKNNDRDGKNNARDGKNNDRDVKNNDRDGKNNDKDVKNNDRDEKNNEIDEKSNERDEENEFEDENDENKHENGIENEIEKRRPPKRNLEEDEIERVNKKTKLLQD